MTHFASGPGLRATSISAATKSSALMRGIIMLGFIFSGVALVVSALSRFLPSFRLITRVVRRRDSHKWGVPAMLIAVPYFLVANIFKGILEDVGNAWFSVPLLWCLGMGIAFLVLGPISLLLLARARVREAIARWNAQRQVRSEPEMEAGAERASSSF